MTLKCLLLFKIYCVICRLLAVVVRTNGDFGTGPTTSDGYASPEARCCPTCQIFTKFGLFQGRLLSKNCENRSRNMAEC